jgi:hypothetical protein
MRRPPLPAGESGYCARSASLQLTAGSASALEKALATPPVNRTGHNARHGRAEKISDAFRECAQTSSAALAKSAVSPGDSDECGGSKNRRLGLMKNVDSPSADFTYT